MSTRNTVFSNASGATYGKITHRGISHIPGTDTVITPGYTNLDTWKVHKIENYGGDPQTITPLQIPEGQIIIPNNGGAGVFIDNDNNIICCQIHFNTYKFNSDGDLLYSNIGDVYDGYGITTDPLENIYIVNYGNTSVTKFDSSLAVIQNYDLKYVAPGWYGTFIQHIVRDSAGNFYITNSSRHSVAKFDSSFNLISEFTTIGAETLVNPIGIAINGFDEIFIGNNDAVPHVIKMGTAGEFIASFGAGTFTSIGALAIQRGNNHVFVTNATPYLTLVVEYSTLGGYITEYNIVDATSAPFIGVSNSGRIFYSSAGSPNIKELTYLAPNWIPGQTESPSAVWDDYNSSIYFTLLTTKMPGTASWDLYRIDGADDIYAVSQEFNSTNYLGGTHPSSVLKAGPSNKLHLLFSGDTDSGHVDNKVLYRRFNTPNETWDTQDDVVIDTVAISEGAYPLDLLVNSSGTIYAFYYFNSGSQWDVVYQSSGDGGDTWGSRTVEMSDVIVGSVSVTILTTDAIHVVGSVASAPGLYYGDMGQSKLLISGTTSAQVSPRLSTIDFGKTILYYGIDNDTHARLNNTGIWSSERLVAAGITANSIDNFNLEQRCYTGDSFDPNESQPALLLWVEPSSPATYDVVYDSGISGISPTPPDVVSGTYVSDSHIDVDWTYSGALQNGFNIYRKVDGGVYVLYDTVGPATFTYPDILTAANHQYQYQVSAFNGSGESASVPTAPIVTSPAATSGVVATRIDSSEIDIAWTSNTPYKDYVEVDRSVNSGVYQVVTNYSGTSPYADMSGTLVDSFQYRLRNHNAAGYSGYDYSNVISAAPAPPLPVSGLVASINVSSGTTTLDWAAGSGTEDSYRIYRQTNSGAFALIATISAPVTQFVDTPSMSPGREYEYRVVSSNSGGNSAAATSNPVYTVPATPLSLSGTWVSDAGIQLDWVTATPDYADNYTIRRSVDGGPFASVGTVSGSITSFVNMPPFGRTEPGHYYNYTVTATNGSGASVAVATASSIATFLESPQNVVFTPTSPTAGHVTWDSVSGAAYYEIWRGIENSTPLLSGTSVSPTYSLVTVDDHKYSVYVVAVYVDGYGTIKSYPSADADIYTRPLQPINQISSWHGVITLTWDDPSRWGEHYEIYRQIGAGPIDFIKTVSFPELSTTDTTTVPDTTYQYYIRTGVDNEHYTVWSRFVLFAPVSTLPLAPTNVVASVEPVVVSGTTHTQIRVTWIDTSATETGFSVDRDVNGVGWVYYTTVPQNTLEFVDDYENLQAGRIYQYRVAAINTSGASLATESNIVDDLLDAPENVLATYVDDTQIDLAWTYTHLNEDGFIVSRSVDGGSFAQMADLPYTTLSYHDMTTADGHSYVYRVHAYNEMGSGVNATSNAISTTPLAPTAVTVVLVSGTLQLSWLPASMPGITFKIQRSIDDYPYDDIIETVNSPYIDSDILYGHEYDYRVAAVNTQGHVSAYTDSNEWKLRRSKRVKISWNRIDSSDVLRYEMFRTSGTVGVTVNSTKIMRILQPPVVSGTTRIEVTDDNKMIDYSNPYKEVYYGPHPWDDHKPVTPATLTATVDQLHNQIDLTWPESPVVSGTSIDAGNQYNYRIRSMDVANNMSAMSDTAMVILGSRLAEIPYTLEVSRNNVTWDLLARVSGTAFVHGPADMEPPFQATNLTIDSERHVSNAAVLLGWINPSGDVGDTYYYRLNVQDAMTNVSDWVLVSGPTTIVMGVTDEQGGYQIYWRVDPGDGLYPDQSLIDSFIVTTSDSIVFDGLAFPGGYSAAVNKQQWDVPSPGDVKYSLRIRDNGGAYAAWQRLSATIPDYSAPDVPAGLIVEPEI